ncbi:unnamed protein product [Meloidogyne enterolobii]|uniref:Uncharacterized protein n=2 Tax=Meloidogyne enterolobii TaxID=390850 RepID=A0A6V7WRT5_MELEN|nr:unnamed protein product [Meloidogyne enterolobii]
MCLCFPELFILFIYFPEGCVFKFILFCIFCFLVCVFRKCLIYILVVCFSVYFVFFGILYFWLCLFL